MNEIYFGLALVLTTQNKQEKTHQKHQKIKPT